MRAVHREFGLQVEDAFEHALHLGDVFANGDLAAQLRFQVLRGRQVVGMGMGFQNPRHLQLLRLHKGDDLVSAVVPGAAGLGVVVEHRVDDGAS